MPTCLCPFNSSPEAPSTEMRLSFQDSSGFLRHGALLMVGTVLGALFNAAFHVVAGRALPESQYAALVAMLGIILALGQPMLAVQNTVAHYVSRLLALGRAPEVFPFFAKAAPARLHVLPPLFAVLAALAYPWLSRFWPVPMPLLCLVAALIPLTLWMSLFSGLWQGLQDFPRLAFIPQLWGVVRFLLTVVAVLLGLRTALWPLSAQFAGVLLVMACGFVYLVRRRPADLAPLRPCPGAPPLAYLLKAILALAAFGVLMNFDASLALRHHPESAGLFAKAATIARTAVFLPVPLAAALFPKVSSDGDAPPDTRRLLLRALAATAALLGCVLAGCLLLPGLPWFILYGRCPEADLPLARALVRALSLSMTPLAFAYLLLNFEISQSRFLRPLLLLPLALLYVMLPPLVAPHLPAGHAVLSIPLVLAAISLLAAFILLPSGLFRKVNP